MMPSADDAGAVLPNERPSSVSTSSPLMLSTGPLALYAASTTTGGLPPCSEVSAVSRTVIRPASAAAFHEARVTCSG